MVCLSFNPRPSSLTGERLAGVAVQALQRGFNPRPSSLTGERGGDACGGQLVAVSIHARHH